MTAYRDIDGQLQDVHVGSVMIAADGRRYVVKSIRKYNEHHDERGRFATGDGSGQSAVEWLESHTAGQAIHEVASRAYAAAGHVGDALTSDRAVHAYKAALETGIAGLLSHELSHAEIPQVDMVIENQIDNLSNNLMVAKGTASKMLRDAANKLKSLRIAGSGALHMTKAEDDDPMLAALDRLLAGLDRYDAKHGIEKFNSDQPRDEHGRFASDGGGASGEHPGKGYSKDAYLDHRGVIHSSNVDDAARALHEDRRVDLNQPHQLSTLLDKLAAEVKEATARGEEAKNINLCNASVSGTNLFCAESKGIPRIKMPQMDDAQTKAFKQHLQDKGYTVSNEKQYASHLRATQDQLIGHKVAAVAERVKADGGRINGRIVISKDDYILDGHHRWAGKIGADAADNKLDNDSKMKVSRVNIGIVQLLKEAHAFTGGKGAQGFDKFNPNHDERGRFAESDGGGAATPVPVEGEPPDPVDTGLHRMYQLKNQWAYLDKQLFQYTDVNPKDPVVKALVDAQLDVVDKMNAFRLTENGKEGFVGPTREMGVRDVVVVGAGVSGLSAGIYGGSEGLNTLVVEANSQAGGQAGASSRIENMIGFPTGTSGQKLTDDGLEQAKRLGADVKFDKQVTGLKYDEKTGLKQLTFADGSTVDARAVVIAGGVQFNHANVPGSDSPDVVYGSSSSLKARVRDGDAIIVGGANSAGQAAMDTAISSRHVTLMARSGLDNMSGYLKDQILAHPRISVMKNEITAIHKDAGGRMTGAALKDGSTLPAKGVLYAIGSRPRTDWAAGVERDDHGFIKVGGSGRDTLETNIPGVYAAGDVRAGSVKRVVTAAADGATAISYTHGYLERTRKI